MNRFIKVDDLVWNTDESFFDDEIDNVCKELKYKYPTAEIDYAIYGVIDKSYPVYAYRVEIAFKNEVDEAQFIIRESV